VQTLNAQLGIAVMSVNDGGGKSKGEDRWFTMDVFVAKKVISFDRWTNKH
jgi:hypothetical protein